MASDNVQPPHTVSSRLIVGQIAAYVAAWLLFLNGEWRRCQELPADLQNLVGLLASLPGDSILYLVLLLAAPLMWRKQQGVAARGARRSSPSPRNRKPAAAARAASTPSTATARARELADSSPASNLILGRESSSRIQVTAGPVAVFLVSLISSAWVGASLIDLPPAYHDEFSYLFQTQTFLSGRVAFPSHPAAELFDQMHVLNEGRFVSRYFPGTGLWLLPWVALGHAVWGQWLAGALSAVLVYLTGLELGGWKTGIIAGLLTALSPGMALFSNLLLAHHPTMLGLSVFLWAFFRMLHTQRLGWAVACGSGLAFAMVCRPMTAAGFAFPFGAYLLVGCARPSALATSWNGDGALQPDRLRGLCLRFLLGIGMPLFLAAVGLFLFNSAATGSGWTTPYQQYTDVYTPRHVYGFNNVVRGEQQLGPRVIDNYDRWAENLTPRLAARNVGKRLWASWYWTLGLLPLLLATVVGLVHWRQHPPGSRLIFAAIVSLHAVHVPYWFDGIMHWHYVFESGPLWLLWFALVSRTVSHVWRDSRPLMPCWWAALVAAAVLSNGWLSDGPWGAPLRQGIGELRFAKRQYAEFNALLQRQVSRRPALVLIEADPADRHIDFVVNRPDLTDDVLRARYLPERVPVERVRQLFPERALYLYRVRDHQLWDLN